MKLLNLACGATRPSPPWTNLDTLRSQLAPGTQERINLDSEANYCDHDVLGGPLPFVENWFDGVLASHCVEHWDCQESVRVLRECRRVLIPGGVIIVSVPDASYFRSVRAEDTPENAVRLFGEPINMDDGEPTFMDYALFFRFHKQVLAEDSLWCLLERAGFTLKARLWLNDDRFYVGDPQPMRLIREQLNRTQFSLLMCGSKQE